MKVFVGETLCCAASDSGCSQTVCRDNWLKCYKESLDDSVEITECQSGWTWFTITNSKKDNRVNQLGKRYFA